VDAHLALPVAGPQAARAWDTPHRALDRAIIGSAGANGREQTKRAISR
jgi:hypothetical protein